MVSQSIKACPSLLSDQVSIHVVDSVQHTKEEPAAFIVVNCQCPSSTL